MWRYIFNLPRSRVFNNGTWRTTNPSSFRDDTVDCATSFTSFDFKRNRCQGSDKNHTDDKWDGSKARQHWGCRFSCTDFSDVVVISSSLLLTCQISQFWKNRQRQEERKRKYLSFESIRQASLNLPSPTCQVIDSSLAQQVVQSTAFLQSEPSGVSNKEQDCDDDFSAKKRVKFDLKPFTTSPDLVEAHAVPSSTGDKYEKYFSQFETDWMNLCEKYNKMKCNKKGVQAARLDQLDEALTHFQTASSVGCAKAFFNLALMNETLQDIETAIPLYHTAVLHGNGQAAHNLALIYRNRNEIGDHAMCIEMLKRASEYGVAESMTELGVMYSSQGDIDAAFRLFQEAAHLKDVDAIYFLGVCFENGYGVEKNECKAAEQYTIASSEEHDEAQCSLARFFQFGLGGLPIDYDSALELYAASAKLGNVSAQDSLSYLQKQMSTPKDEVKRTKGSKGLHSSSSAPHIYISLQRHLLEINHAEWEFSLPSCSKSWCDFNKYVTTTGNNTTEVNSDCINPVINEIGNVKFSIGCDEARDDCKILDRDFSNKGFSLIDMKRNVGILKLNTSIGDLSQVYKTDAYKIEEGEGSEFSFGSKWSDSDSCVAFGDNCLKAKLVSRSALAV